MLKLKCCAQNYAWGRPAENSEVALLCESNGEAVDKSKPYAELWMGSHPNGPSRIGDAERTLGDWLQCRPESLGEKVQARFGAQLPYLFKVLSVRTALSIQSHPDKKLAERLHKERPNVYKDPNHKPEMAIALSDFQALCGFVTNSQLVEAVKTTPELRTCIGEEGSESLMGKTEDKKQALKDAFTSLMTCKEEVYSVAVSDLASRLEKDSKTRELTDKERLVVTLNAQYPKDIGVLAAYFLNLVKLQPGQAMYLPANEPHAYISGELVECMAASDNVVRAGLTPKLRDTGVLCSSLTYTQGPPTILNGDAVDEYVKCYRPPFDEFEVHSISIPKGVKSTLPVNEGPVILLVQNGLGSAQAYTTIVDESLARSTTVKRGNAFFVPANTSIEIAAKEHLTMWAACVNSQVLDPSTGPRGPASNIVPAPLQVNEAHQN